jgi:hypothetical protein
MLNQHTLRASQLRLVILLFASALLLALFSCGGNRALTQQGTPRQFAADDAVAQALALQPPSGVDPAVFNKLRDELVRQLTLRAEGKLPAAAPSGAGGQVDDLAYDSLTGALTWSYANTGDYNLDGIVGVADITPLALYFGADTDDGIGYDAYETWLDGDGNGVIGIGDITPLAMGFGAQVSAYNVACSSGLDSGYAQVSTVGFGESDGGVIPPKFTYYDLALPSFGAYCKVQPLDNLSVGGIESLALDIASGNTIITNGVIGPEGGSIGDGSVAVDVQPGTFSADTPVSVETGPDGRYEDQASGGFYIVGIPDTFSQPITVRLKMTEPPGPDGIPLLALEEGEVLLYGTQAAPGRDARYFQGTFDNGWFTATIPPTANDLGTSSLRSASAETDKRVYVTVVNRRHYLNSTGGRFLVYFPAGDEVLASTVADALDNAYTQIEGLGMSWARRTTWPLEVTIRIMGASSFDGEMLTSRFWGVNGATITINSTNMASDDIAKATAGHELMHVAQYLYDKRNRISSSASGGGWVWMDEATATWFEKRMATATSYIPSTATTNVAFLSEALATDTSEHGYGASMFMTYMARKQGNAVIGDVSKLKWDNYQPIDALKNKTSSLIAVDWNLFCESFMKLAVYGAGTYPTPGEINSLQQETFLFDQDLSTWTHSFTWSSAPDISARVYRLQFKQYFGPIKPGAQWQAYDDLVISFYGNNTAVSPVDAAYIICTYASNTWTFIAASSDHEYTVKDLKAVADANGAVYILVVNGSATAPYLGARAEPIHLDVERKEDFLTQIQKCNEMRFELGCNARLANSRSEEWEVDGFGTTWNFNTIQWVGASFTSDLESLINGTSTSNFIVAGTVDPVARTVSLTYNSYGEDSESGTSGEDIFAYTDVPLSTNWADYNRAFAKIYGPDCASMVTSFSHVYRELFGSYTVTALSLSFPNPDGSDYISVDFTKDYFLNW